MPKPVALFILDGWGIRDMSEGNAPQHAQTPNYDRWLKEYERAVLDASGEAVGLPEGQMGNSEVGHLNLGAGRVVYQDITRIHKSIREGGFFEIDVLQNGFKQAKAHGKKVHLIGLLGSGGVHSHEDHMYALLKMAKQNGVNPIVHVITDGRDTPAESGIRFAQKLESFVADEGVGILASLSGRYYAMDRDNRWERTGKAYHVMATHEAEKSFGSVTQGIQASYDEGVTDEFILPVAIDTDEDVTIDAGDTIIFYNFRADRMRQIVKVFAFDDFDGFERAYLEDLTLITMTEYAKELAVEVAFPDQNIDKVLAQVISEAGLSQMHAAETEKYPHVTYFFNGGEEEAYANESRILVNSPKVATYDLQPEMSAYELTDKVEAHIQGEKPDFVLVNYANPDMVGHTGVMEAAVRACEAVDDCVGRLVKLILAQGGVALVTADHGNCERMVELSTGESHTYHTTNPVSFIVIGNDYILPKTRGALCDVAPTILELLGVAQPAEMDGQSLIAAYGKSDE